MLVKEGELRQGPPSIKKTILTFHNQVARVLSIKKECNDLS